MQFGVGVNQYPGADAEGFVHELNNQLLAKTFFQQIRQECVVEFFHASRWLVDDAVDASFVLINQIGVQCCVCVFIK